MKLLSVFLAMAISQNLYASSVTPTPRQTLVLSNHAVPDGAAGIYVNAQCYGTNNRGTNNPMSPASRIVLVLKSPDSKTLLIDFPSALVQPGGVSAAQDCGATMLAGTSLKTPAGQTTIESALTSWQNGGAEIVTAFSADNLNKLNGRTSFSCKEFPLPIASKFNVTNVSDYYAIQVFNQAMSPTAFYGYNGIMDRGTKIDLKINTAAGGYSDTNQFLYITSIFPGQDGFCGGFHSPLMVFFDENYPGFSGVSTLLKGKERPTTWVEADHPGYLLVHLKKKTAPIKAENLFGDTVDFKNGFEALKPLDSNKDGKISKADKEFKNLYLWQDKNSNSQNDQGELTTLSSQKIVEIDLNYNPDYREEKQNAILKGKTKFIFQDAKGEKKEGIIFDIYFADSEK